MKETPVLSIIVPAFNEAEVLDNTLARLTLVVNRLIESEKASPQSHICIVDDGSTDATWEIVEKTSGENGLIAGIRLSRNFGHQNALMAGFKTVLADVYISIDADLQDDEAVIFEMMDQYHNGAHVVYGVRKERESDTCFKRFSAGMFYRVMGSAGACTIDNHGDFRLMSREVVRELNHFREVNLFLRAIVPSIGFQSATVYYKRQKREGGTSKYTLKKMTSFAWDGITSFSTIPLKLVSLTGVTVFGLSMAGVVYAVIQKLSGNVIPGWTSTVLPIFFLGGVQLLCVGVVGEYIGKIYREVKQRPRFIIEKQCGTNSLSSNEP